jgi:vacuolar protein sorting-associated protein 45
MNHVTFMLKNVYNFIFRLLIKELSAPRYGSYYLYFTDQVKKSDLKQLAEADSFEVVIDVKEIPSDFLVLESHVFLTSGVSRPMKNLQWNPDNDNLAFKR